MNPVNDGPGLLDLEKKQNKKKVESGGLEPQLLTSRINRLTADPKKDSSSNYS